MFGWCFKHNKNQCEVTNEIQVVDRYNTIYPFSVHEQDYIAEKFIDKFTLDFATEHPVYWRGFIFEKDSVFNYFLSKYTTVPFKLERYKNLFGANVKLDGSEMIYDLSKSVEKIKKS